MEENLTEEQVAVMMIFGTSEEKLKSLKYCQTEHIKRKKEKYDELGYAENLPGDL